MSAASRTSHQVPEALAAIPGSQQSPTFNEPWEAQAFAITLALHRRGLFTWQEWSQTLGEEIKGAQHLGDPDLGGTYYGHWLAAIERIIQRKGIANQNALAHYKQAWHNAARRTPHGDPIVLAPQDMP